MFTPDMLESIKKVEATRADRIGVDVYKRQGLHQGYGW